MSKFYITTAIDYPNASPHMGHAYEKIVADCYARWHRFLGDSTYFLTGTDENGQKLSEAAQSSGEPVKSFVDKNVAIFQELCSKLNISHDDFIRTTDDRHKKVCQELWKKLDAGGDIVFGKYSGDYCLSCENFYTSLQAPEGLCPYHHKKLELKEEEGYFFKMSRYGEWIIDYLEKHPNFIVPAKIHRELTSRLKKDGVKDVAFSRPNKDWGIPVPGDERFVMYTWADALVNYYSGVVSTGREELWPAEVHVIGKDIIWFHCVIWPCMLQAAKLELPRQVYVHGMVLGSDGKKMSKSLGNVLDPLSLLEQYPLDTFRYYMLRSLPAQEDGIFSEKELVERHNCELGNDYGNLIMRVVKLALNALGSDIEGTGVKQDVSLDKTFHQMSEHMKMREHHRALDTLWRGVNDINGYVNTQEPWKHKKNPDSLRPIIYNCCFALHSLALLLSPFLPSTSTQTLAWLGVDNTAFDKLHFGEITYHLSTPEALFQKI